MKAQHANISFISSFFVIVIIIILLAAFVLMGYNQYLTNTRIQYALDCLVANNKVLDEVTSEESTGENSTVDTGLNNSTLETNILSSVELSSAIAYLSKVQEVSSNNNTTALLSLLYAVLSSLILSYGAKILRLSENDKKKLSEELRERCQADIDGVLEGLLLQTHISSVIVAMNEAITSFQTLKILLLQNNQDSLETSNKVFLQCLNTVNNELNTLNDKSGEKFMACPNFASIELVYSSLHKHYEIYESMSLPSEIDDSAAVKAKMDKISACFEAIRKKKCET